MPILDSQTESIEEQKAIIYTFAMTYLQSIKNLLRTQSSEIELKRHQFIIKFFCIALTILVLPHLALTIYSQMQALILLLGAYLLALVFVFYKTLKNNICISKVLFISSTAFFFSILTYFLGVEHGFNQILLALLITPSLIFSFRNQRELFISIFFQLIIIFCYIYLRNLNPYSHYSLTYTESVYLQYLTDTLQIALIAIQVGYLLFTVNKEEHTLQKTLNEMSGYKQALESASIVAYTDRSGKILDVNDMFCEISGYEKDELIGQNHRILKSGLHDAAFYKSLWFTITSGKIWRGEICNKKKSGELYWVDSVIAPIYDAESDNLYYLSVRFDITKKKQSEAQLLQASKMSSLGEMAGGIAHEINTPLGVIQMRADQILSQTENEEAPLNREKINKNAKIIDETVERISKIITGLRAFSRNSSNDKMTMNSVSKIVHETLDLCSQKLKNKNVYIEVDIDPDLLIKCRPTEVSQVLLNLIGNSIDAIESLAERWIKIVSATNSGHVEISVTDSGGGIPLNVQNKMMQPFFTTKEIGKGTGLGLSISRGIIQSHGGSLEIDNSSPHTKFIIKLPSINKES